MRRPLFSFLILLTIASCSPFENGLDDELRFNINASVNSKGARAYIFPSSSDLAAIPQDPQNPLTAKKVELGRMLFHETVFSTVGKFDDLAGTYSCASCHHVAAGFQAGMRQGIGDGGVGFGTAGEGRKMDIMAAEKDVDVQPLRSPSAMNLAYQPNLLWNGQFGATAVNIGTEGEWTDGTPKAVNKLGYEGLETQAIAGLEVHRMDYTAEAIAANGYKAYFDEALGDLPEDRRYSAEGAGQAIAAYERTLLASQAPFQRWLKGDLGAMTEAQKEGANLFFTKAECTNCHYGAAMAAMEFHAIGMGDFDESDVLNFKSDDPSKLGRGSFTKRDEDNYKFKVPQLYNLKDSPFYGHGGSFTSIREVIEYKNAALAQSGEVEEERLSSYFKPLKLSSHEVDLLVDFIENALYDPSLDRYLPESVLSNSCFPNNDFLSKKELGCD